MKALFTYIINLTHEGQGNIKKTNFPKEVNEEPSYTGVSITINRTDNNSISMDFEIETHDADKEGEMNRSELEKMFHTAVGLEGIIAIVNERLDNGKSSTSK